MFKRLLWLSIGATLGLGTSWWVTRTVKQKIERYAPARITSRVAQRARSVGDDVRAALADGRTAMQEKEALLRAELEQRNPPRSR